MSHGKNVAAAWQKRADWLARWAMVRLVNRTDLWGRYYSVEKRRITSNGDPILSHLSPSRRRRGSLLLSEAALAKHFRGDQAGHVLGVHSAGISHTSKWIAIDLERHHQKITPVENLRAASHWKDELISMGLSPLLIDTDGAGGYHLLTLFRDPLPTAKAFEFVQRLVRDYEELGLEHAPVILPNGPSSDDNNWLRMPGRHPITGHWSKVWNGHHWLEGADAVEALLRSHGDSPMAIRKLAVGGSITLPMNAPNGDGAYEEAANETSRIVQPANGKLRNLSLGTDERQVLCHLLNAAAQGNEEPAFAKLYEAGISEEAFEIPLHRQIFASIDQLHTQGERITSTTVAENVRSEDRAAALEAIDEMMSASPESCEKFQGHLASIVRRMGGRQAEIASPETDQVISDPSLEELLQIWPHLTSTVRQSILSLAQAANPPASYDAGMAGAS